MFFPEPANLQTPLYIFDLDGTLALIERRRPLIEEPDSGACVECHGYGAMRESTGDKDYEESECPVCKGTGKFVPQWDAFYEACDRDQPNWPVIGTMLQLYSVGCDVRIWSGRSDAVKQKTLMWLHAATRIPLIKLEHMLKMREAADYTPDDQLKRKWLNTMPKQQRERLAAVFDDRNKVVAMWRSAGVSCFQVAFGDF
jgi:hypothetical protein